MQNSLFEAICRVGIFMICVRAILHFRPQEVYEKYLRLLAGIMILIQLFLPVGRFLLGKGGQEAAEVLEQFRRQLEQGMEEAVENAAEADALLEQMTLEEVQRRLEEQQEAAEQEGQNAPQEEDMKRENTVREDGADVGNTGLEGEEEIAVKVEPVEPVIINPVKPETRKD